MHEPFFFNKYIFFIFIQFNNFIFYLKEITFFFYFFIHYYYNFLFFYTKHCKNSFDRARNDFVLLFTCYMRWERLDIDCLDLECCLKKEIHTEKDKSNPVWFYIFWILFWIFWVDELVCGCSKGVSEVFWGWNVLKIRFF
jgi:hypothetical protein